MTERVEGATIPEPMYQAVTDKLSAEIRENLQLRAENLVLERENARLVGELMAARTEVGPPDHADAVFNAGREAL